MTGRGTETADVLVAGARRLRSAGVEQPGLDARLLLGHALGVGQVDLILRHGEPVDAEAARCFERLIDRRVAREPVSRIMGTREFYGRTFQVSPAVLDPRPDTEILVEAALEMAASRLLDQDQEWPRQILDLGTGSGAILITLLAEWPRVIGLGVDISAGALKIAAGNASRLGVMERADFVCSDWDASLTGQFDLIVSNPPYIASRQIDRLDKEVAGFDPRLALDGGVDGLGAYRRLADLCPRRLNKNGWLLVEIGCDQADDVKTIFADAGLVCGGTRADLAGRDRVIAASHGRDEKPDTKADGREKALGMPGRSS